MPILRKRKSKHLLSLLYEYASGRINEAYLEYTHYDKLNKYAIHSMNVSPSVGEITTLIVYRKTSRTRFALIVILVHPSLRRLGYGSLVINEFIEFLRKPTQNINLVLHSVKQSIPFYEHLGFCRIKPTTFLKNYEDIKSSDEGCCFLITINQLPNRV